MFFLCMPTAFPAATVQICRSTWPCRGCNRGFNFPLTFSHLHNRFSIVSLIYTLQPSAPLTACFFCFHLGSESSMAGVKCAGTHRLRSHTSRLKTDHFSLFKPVCVCHCDWICVSSVSVCSSDLYPVAFVVNARLPSLRHFIEPEFRF